MIPRCEFQMNSTAAGLTPSPRFVTLARVMEIKKAVITAAGKNQRTLPLQTLVDRDGTGKTALRIIIEEVLQAGVEEIAIVISPGDEKAYESAAGTHASRLQFIEQSQPLGYVHAVY